MLSDNIRNYRKENNMSQDELAEKLGVSRQSVSLWETGQTQPTIDNIIALAKIFNISSDEILEGSDRANMIKEKTAEEKRNGKPKIIATIVISAAVIACSVLLFVISKNNKLKNNGGDSSAGANGNISQSESSNAGGAKKPDAAKAVSGNTGNVKNNNSDSGAASVADNKTTAGNTDSETPSAAEAVKQFDLFSYCKDFAIKKGNLNGDYTIYQQRASKYGGNANEYFSISYWGDSNMVEFCLHCPLDETYSINFYIRMRGGYNKKYEYLSSRYYRDNGESVRSAAGYIDPSVFSDNYPLSCDEYKGSFDGQNEFMEESRVGICDLIRCLKKFVDTENMECDFSAFEFVNF